MHRAKSNTSLDERALTEAAKALLDERDLPGLEPCHMKASARAAVAAYLAALPEPPLDELRAEGDKLREALDEAQIVLESFIGGGLLSGGNREHAEIVLKLIRFALASTTTTPEESDGA